MENVNQNNSEIPLHNNYSVYYIKTKTKTKQKITSVAQGKEKLNPYSLQNCIAVEDRTGVLQKSLNDLVIPLLGI